MKKLKRLPLMISLLIVIAVFAPSSTFAAPDDLGLTYSVSPTIAGMYGADINIVIHAENRGSTPITRLNIGVTTISGYTQEWNGTINVGATRTLSFLVPFSEEDFNTDKLLTVGINNDGDDAVDGVQVRTFQVEGTWHIFSCAAAPTPDQAAYSVGDMVEISHYFTNTFESHAATNVRSRCYIFKESGGMVRNNVFIDHGIVMPLGSVENTFTHTFAEEDTGRVIVAYQLLYTMMGHDYDSRVQTLEFDVVSPVTDISFDAHLHASPTEIDAGDTVTFTIDITNTSESAISSFDIYNAEAGHEAGLEGLPSGGSGNTDLTVSIHETTDVSYVVQAAAGSFTSTKETNTVHITVREPAADPTESATEPPAESASAAPSSSHEAAADADHSDDASAVEMPAETPSQDVSSADEALTETDTHPSAKPSSAVIQPQSQNNLLYFIIAVLALLIAGTAVALLLILRKKKSAQTKQVKNKKRTDSL